MGCCRVLQDADKAPARVVHVISREPSLAAGEPRLISFIYSPGEVEHPSAGMAEYSYVKKGEQG